MDTNYTVVPGCSIIQYSTGPILVYPGTSLGFLWRRLASDSWNGGSSKTYGFRWLSFRSIPAYGQYGQYGTGVSQVMCGT